MGVDLIGRFFLVFSSLFVIVEPFGAVPAFLSLTKDHTNDEIKRVILRACLFGPAVLIFFSIFGGWVFKFLGVEMSAFRAAGGLLLLLTALDMLRASKQREGCRCSAEEMNSKQERDDISLVPLGIPMLAGPGAITSIMVFSTDHGSQHTMQFAVIVLAIVVTFIISYFVLRSSVPIKSLLGKSGISVIERIMGLLLAALSLQFIIQGVMGLLKQY
jgi:multiple antibiotic resistance protein